MLDPTTLVYYALICGALSLAGPVFQRPAVRFAVGICVGLVAAAVLPQVQTLLAMLAG